MSRNVTLHRYQPFIALANGRYKSKGRFYTYNEALAWARRMLEIYGDSGAIGAVKIVFPIAA